MIRRSATTIRSARILSELGCALVSTWRVWSVDGEGERREGCFGLAAEAEDGTLVGFAHCVVHPTTWSKGATCYLEDLFVDPGHRGTAAARSLIEAAGEQGRAAGAETLYWHTQAFNGRARSLYDTVAQLTSFVHYERQLG